MKNSLLYPLLAIFAVLWFASGQSTHQDLHRGISSCKQIEISYNILVDITPNYEFQVKKYFTATFTFCSSNKQIQEKNPTFFLSDQSRTFHIKPPKWEPFHQTLYNTADTGDDHHIL
jgi:hypothetical protein